MIKNATFIQAHEVADFLYEYFQLEHTLILNLVNTLTVLGALKFFGKSIFSFVILPFLSSILEIPL
jgi:hypothetical protein